MKIHDWEVRLALDWQEQGFILLISRPVSVDQSKLMAPDGSITLHNRMEEVPRDRSVLPDQPLGLWRWVRVVPTVHGVVRSGGVQGGSEMTDEDRILSEWIHQVRCHQSEPPPPSTLFHWENAASSLEAQLGTIKRTVLTLDKKLQDCQRRSRARQARISILETGLSAHKSEAELWKTRVLELEAERTCDNCDGERCEQCCHTGGREGCGRGDEDMWRAPRKEGEE